MRRVSIYTDGSCHGNPGYGGYAAVVLENGVTKEVHGGDFHTTANRMELTAVIEGINLLCSASEITIYTDSRYVANNINRKDLRAYVKTYKRKNADLWEQILQLSIVHKISAIWIKGHNGDKFNQRCDYLANGEAYKMEKETPLRLAVFSEMLIDICAPAEKIAKKHNMSVHTVRKYQDQFMLHRNLVTQSVG